MSTATKVTQIRNHLLPLTLENAVNGSRFYKNTLGKLLPKVKTVNHLDVLPILHKEDMVKNLADVLCGSSPNDLLTFTSGTTGEPLVVRRNSSEVEELRKCGDLLNSKIRTLPLVLEISDVAHGHPLPSPPDNIIHVPAQTLEHLNWIKELLSGSQNYAFGERKISAIQAQYATLLRLTLFFLHMGIEPSKFGISNISVTSHHVTKSWREFFEKQWNSNLTDTYSMSEFANNGAIECKDCGFQHFLLPTVIPEIVDPLTNETVKKGLGILVLTSLHPFTQRQPFIRYWTGDLVECGPKCERDEIGFRFKGRLSHSQFLNRRGKFFPLIIPVDLHEILDSIPEIKRSSLGRFGYNDSDIDLNRAPFFENSEPTEAMLRLSVKHYLSEAQQQNHRLAIDIGLTYVPELYPGRINWLSQEINKGLREGNRFLNKAMEEKIVEMQIRFFPPYLAPPSVTL